MNRLLLFAALVAGPCQAADTARPASEVRKRLSAIVRESLPPAPTPAREGEAVDGPVLELEPIVVTESKGVREMARLLAAEKERVKAAGFTPLQGGTIFRHERLELGAWWEPDSGWQFLKLKW